MSILVNGETKIIIQGITGKQGTKICREMIDYGTQVVAGVTPGKAGTKVNGIPVFDTIADALQAFPDANTSLVSVPRNMAKQAASDAIMSGQIKLVNVLTEGIPNQDAAYMVDLAKDYGVRVVGPASVGIIAPEFHVKTGAIGGSDPGVFYPGKIAVFSKSGGMCMSLALDIFNKLGYGVNIVVGIGGDRIAGTTFKDLLELARDDTDIRLIIMNGEVGGNYEEEAAEYIKSTGYPKRVVARMSGIGGEALFAKGSRMGHAGAIIGEGDEGSYESKVQALEGAGVPVARSSEELITFVEREMPRRGHDFEKAIASDVEIVAISKAKLEGLKTQVRAVQTKTSLTQLLNGIPYFRGFALPELMIKATIPDAIYMALNEEDATPETMEQFVAAWDYCRKNAQVPDVAIKAAQGSYKAGNSLNAACAAGALTLPEFAAGADKPEFLFDAECSALTHIQQVTTIIGAILGNPIKAGDTRPFNDQFFSALAGREPSAAEADLLRAIFIACIDHTPATPSSLAAMTSYSGGNSLKTALAAGISAMGDVHAGAGEGAAAFLSKYLSEFNAAMKEKGSYEYSGITVNTIEGLADLVIKIFTGKLGGEKKKIPGYGHRYYSLYGEDQRAVALIEIAQKNGVAGGHVKLALAIESALKQKSYGLCMNVDGAIGALLCDMGITSRAGKATFIIPRTAGILGELLEQKAGSFFRLANESVIYTGPEPGRDFTPVLE
ncbi:MAG: hypothetical protein NT018_08405 [Armatimonadetes bacterium]|nr:hypothetical protein [Armatimonadota bacterium]